MTITTTNPHSWLFAHLKTVQGYDSIEEAKKALVFIYSWGNTESLSELYDKYPRQYMQMKRELGTPRKKASSQLDAARKRLIAAIFGNLEQRGITADIAYVKGIACQGAKVERFNDILLNDLKNLYNRFKNKNLKAELDSLLEDI